jgi:nitrite reductase (NADH) large subunit
MAGLRFLQELLKRGRDRYDISVFGEESHSAYNRILLSSVLAGEKTLDDIMLADASWYTDNGILLKSGRKVIAIDRDTQTVEADDGSRTPYDYLVIATGSRPFIIPVPGHTLPGVLTFRDIQDVQAMIAGSAQYRRAAVIGGGLLGLEAANGLLKRGMEVSVIHLMPSLMDRQLDVKAAELLRQELESFGLKFIMPAETEAILGSDHVEGVRFKDGHEIPADLVVMAVGIRPNVELARAAGLDCGRGILVDDTLRTSDPHIYALGECVEHDNQTYGLVAPLYEQAVVCADYLTGRSDTAYKGSLVYTSLKVTGVQLFSAGDFQEKEGRESLFLFDPGRGVYKKLVLEDNRLCGTVLYGETTDGTWYNELMTSGRNVAPMREHLIFGQRFAEMEPAQPSRTA